MGTLTSLTLPMGSESHPKTLTQAEVNTLIKVYYDTSITDKHVSGWGYKSALTKREDYLLRQLGLIMSHSGNLRNDTWSLSASTNRLLGGGNLTLSLTGNTVLMKEVTLSIETVTVTYGSMTSAQLRSKLSLSGTRLTFSSTLPSYATGTVVIKATPLWGDADAKTVTINLASVNIHTTWINPSTFTVSLDNEGGKELITDYINQCNCYVFNSAGTQMALIKSAVFNGNYSGMSGGTVTFNDGTVASIADLNTAGCNFMVLRPAMNVLVGYDDGGLEILRNTGRYNIYGGKTFPKKYIGMFKAFNQNGILKSQPNRIPTGAQTIAVFQSQAKAGGASYGLWNYSDWCKENALHLSYFDNTNYETNVGVGRIDSYDNVRNIVTGFTLPFVGQKTCAVRETVDKNGNAVNCLNFFGIEGLGEQIWEFVIGFRHDGSTAYVWDENAWSEDHAADRTFSLRVTSASQSYIKSIIAGEHFDMMPRVVNGTSATGMCDGHWIATSGRVLYVGGSANLGSICGLSASGANNAFSLSSANIGSRLAFYGDDPSLVTGSAFVAALY